MFTVAVKMSVLTGVYGLDSLLVSHRWPLAELQFLVAEVIPLLETAVADKKPVYILPLKW